MRGCMNGSPPVTRSFETPRAFAAFANDSSSSASQLRCLLAVSSPPSPQYSQRKLQLLVTGNVRNGKTPSARFSCEPRISQSGKRLVMRCTPFRDHDRKSEGPVTAHDPVEPTHKEVRGWRPRRTRAPGSESRRPPPSCDGWYIPYGAVMSQ
jgi:hypothetical protein